MSSSGVIRTHGLDGAPTTSFDSSRRRIEREDIAFAQANRHRMGWQTMATIRAVNMHDLRRACDQAYVEAHGLAAPAKAAPAARAAEVARKGPPPLDPVKALRAIKKGAAGLDDLAELLACTKRGAKGAVEDLRARGWVAGHANSFTGWLVTQAGEAVLRNGRP